MSLALKGGMSFLFLFGVGFFFLQRVMDNRSFPLGMSLALSYGLGVGLVSYGMFCLGALGAPLDTLSVSFGGQLLILCVLGLVFFTTQKTGRLSRPEKPEMLTGIWKRWQIGVLLVVGLFIAFQAGFVIYRALAFPIVTWDAVATISFKAKIFYYEKAFYAQRLPHNSYPLMLPLIEAWLSFCNGAWNDYLLKLLFPAAFFSYAVVHYHFLRRYVTVFWSVLGIGLLLCSPFFVFQSTIAYRDIVMSYFNCSTILLLLIWMKRPERSLLLTCAVFSGLTILVKLEGTIYAAIHAFLLGVLMHGMKFSKGERLRNFCLLVTILLAFYLPFYAFKKSLGITAMSNRLLPQVTPAIGGRVWTILTAFHDALIVKGSWGLLWPFLGVCILKGYHRVGAMKEIRLILLSIGIFMFAYIVFFLFTSTEICYGTTLSRVILHFYPLCPMAIALLVFPLKDVEEEFL